MGPPAQLSSIGDRMKLCSKCGENAPTSGSWCRDCRAKKERDRRRADPNFKPKAVYTTEEERKAGRLAAAKKWRESNAEEARAASRRAYANHRGARIAASRKAQGARKQATPAWANSKAIQEFYFAADFLGMVTGEWHHVDHIVPLHGKINDQQIVCGLHCEQNLQVLIATDNLAKSNRYWPDMPGA